MSKSTCAPLSISIIAFITNVSFYSCFSNYYNYQVDTRFSIFLGVLGKAQLDNNLLSILGIAKI